MTEKRIIIFPSTQPNQFKGQPITEGQWAKLVCDRAKPLLESWGWHVEMPWAYDANGDLSELSAQRVEGQRLQGLRQHLVLSVHADWTGSSKRNGILMIYRAERPGDRVWAESFGRIMGELSGLGYEKTVDESYTSVKRLGIMRVPGPNILVEIGEFGTAGEAAWLVQYQGKIAASLASAIEHSAHLVYGTPLAAEETMPIDNTSEAAFKKADALLKELGVIDKTRTHPWQDAAGVGLLWTAVSKAVAPLYERIEALEKAAEPPK